MVKSAAEEAEWAAQWAGELCWVTWVTEEEAILAAETWVAAAARWAADADPMIDLIGLARQARWAGMSHAKKQPAGPEEWAAGRALWALQRVLIAASQMAAAAVEIVHASVAAATWAAQVDPNVDLVGLARQARGQA